MTILGKIIETKKEEVALQKTKVTIEQFKQYPHFSGTCNSLKNNLLKEGSSGIIAEFKQKSPSKGEINNSAGIEEVTRGYSEAGVAGISVLTDSEYFGGSLMNLLKARDANPGTPILRKDFIIDPFQLYEAKAFGADVILLIAACLEKDLAEELARLAKQLGLEVLMEVHDAGELEKVNSYVDMIGVNNRNLNTFQVDTRTSENLGTLIHEQYVKISESGISHPETIRMLRKIGYRGFLIGETFMKTGNPAGACKKFISEL